MVAVPTGREWVSGPENSIRLMRDSGRYGCNLHIRPLLKRSRAACPARRAGSPRPGKVKSGLIWFESDGGTTPESNIILCSALTSSILRRDSQTALGIPLECCSLCCSAPASPCPSVSSVRWVAGWGCDCPEDPGGLTTDGLKSLCSDRSCSKEVVERDELPKPEVPVTKKQEFVKDHVC